MCKLDSIDIPEIGPVNVVYRESPHQGRLTVRRPDLIVIHYTAGGPASTSAEWFRRPESRASAHFVIPRHPHAVSTPIIQCVPLDREAWHAGRSEWRGQPHVSRWSWGIELANWGPVVYEDGSWRSLVGHRPVERAVEIAGKWYEVFPREQILALGALAAQMIRMAQDLGEPMEIVGHQHVAMPRGRKPDPGPAFPWEAFAAAIEAVGVPVGPRHGVWIYPLHGERLE